MVIATKIRAKTEVMVGFILIDSPVTTQPGDIAVTDLTWKELLQRVSTKRLSRMYESRYRDAEHMELFPRMKMRDIGLMRASITLWSLVVAVLSLLVSRTAVADGWNFVIAPYLLVPTITGDASLGRVDNAEVDLSGADIFKSLQLGAMLQGEARHASGYGVLLNYAFMDLGNDFSGPRGYTNVDTDVF